MNIDGIKLENFTVFKDVELKFDKGINVFIGENGTGKTHILKVLYSACQSSNPKVSFPNKIVRTLYPDDYKISRLITRGIGNRGTNIARIKVSARNDVDVSAKNLTMEFNHKTKKWDAAIKGEEGWENEFKNTSSIYIPAKEILSNSYNLAAAIEKDNVRFDDTYIDIINSAKVDVTVGRNSKERDTRLKAIEEIIGGKVSYDKERDEFYMKVANSKREFNLEAEGIRKMALLWQLVKNGTLEKGAVLFWDEPEANINPAYISIIVELLYTLQRDGVQIFVSTHDYMLAKYFETRKKKDTSILFHSFRKKENIVEYSSASRFADLNNNLIIDSFDNLLNEIYAKQTGE